MHNAESEFLHGALTRRVLACAYEVHWGQGCWKAPTGRAWHASWGLRGLHHKMEAAVPIAYKGETLDNGYRADFIVEDKVIVELKAMEQLLPVHPQLLTYLRLSGLHVGLLINFNVSSLRNGIKRVVHKARLT